MVKVETESWIIDGLPTKTSTVNSLRRCLSLRLPNPKHELMFSQLFICLIA